MPDLQALLDLLEHANGPAERVPSADGWEGRVMPLRRCDEQCSYSASYRQVQQDAVAALPATVPAMQRAFGSKLDSHLFVAKADLCRAAIIRLAMSREPRAGTVEQTAHIAPVGRREEVSDAARLAL